jgi:DNA-binding beta-propeller fold protein YncE
MRRNYCLISISLAAALASAVVPSRAATFGTVVPITGSASDIALDQSRGLLYVANFTANRIDVMSTADYSIHSSMNVAPQPVALALSFDSQFLLIAHYGNFTAPETGQNLVTLINLNTNTQQTFATGDPPLGVAFTSDGQAFIVTTTSFVAFDPISGAMIVLATFADVAQSLPAPWPPFPPR